MSKFDDVTRQIKAQLEAGTRPWIKPWNGGGSPIPKRATGEYYQGNPGPSPEFGELVLTREDPVVDFS